MITLKELPAVTIPVDHYWPDDVITREPVSFVIFRDNASLKAVPLLSNEERLTTGLPEELRFVYINDCIVEANSMEEEPRRVIKEIILELEAQERI